MGKMAADATAGKIPCMTKEEVSIMFERHKKFLTLIGTLVFVGLLMGSAISTPVAHSASPTPSSLVPLYRLYKRSSTDHLYTTSTTERDNAEKKLGYTSEGVAACIWPATASGLVPLYGLYSARATDHVYTTSSAEKDSAVQDLGYTFEGITGYISPVKATNLVPLFRLYNPPPIDHLYTTNASEKDNAMLNEGYNYEGITGFVSPATAC